MLATSSHSPDFAVPKEVSEFWMTVGAVFETLKLLRNSVLATLVDREFMKMSNL